MKANKQTTISKIQEDFKAIDVFDDLDFRVEEISNRLLQHVLNYMEDRNMSRKKLATLIGTSPSYITQLFNNTRTLNISIVAKIEQALNVRFEVNLKDLGIRNKWTDNIPVYTTIETNPLPGTNTNRFNPKELSSCLNEEIVNYSNLSDISNEQSAQQSEDLYSYPKAA